MALASPRLGDTETLKVDALDRGRSPGGIELDGHRGGGGADEHDPGDDDGDLTVDWDAADAERGKTRRASGGSVDDVAVEQRCLRGAHGGEVEREPGTDVPHPSRPSTLRRRGLGRSSRTMGDGPRGQRTSSEQRPKGRRSSE